MSGSVMSFSIFHWIIILFVFGVFQVPFWKIATKTGYPGTASLLLLIPVINIAIIWLFAFSSWPATRK